MKCLKCGATLTDSDFCNRCGADVKIFKKIFFTSNAFYNRALDKAKVRDLSGAAEDLKNSLKLNKKNIQARNLLGLIYYEMGNVVGALSEWVISKNHSTNNNIADDYINKLHKNANSLESVNNSLKKYNQALLYARQGSGDLAIIQLKKVLSVNPKLMIAHQLLALMYMQQEEMELAKKELNKTLSVDRGNVLSLHLMQEISQQDEKDGGTKKTSNTISEEAISYRSGNETIIQPRMYKDNSNKNVAVNIAIGMVIGIAISWFVIAPARIQGIKNSANQQVVDYSDQIDAKTATIDSLTQELEDAKTAKDDAQAKASDAEGTITSYNSLFAAQTYAQNNDFENAAVQMEKVDTGLLSDGANELYNSLSATVYEQVIKQYYREGYSFYTAKNYSEAVKSFEKALEYNKNDADVVNYLARSYEALGDEENAKKYYQQVIELLPNTERASRAQNYLNSHS